jgi:hypothetical protein
MFLIRWIRELSSIPFLWAGRLATMLKRPADAPLFAAAWHISHNGRTGVMALGAVYRRQGVQIATALAESWTRRCPRPETAAFAGLLAIDAKDRDLAKSYLEQGRQLGDDKAGMLDTLEFSVAGLTKGAEPVTQLAQRLEARSDLPPRLSKKVLAELLWDDMFGGRWESAVARAHHMLAVADSPEAQAALWALALKSGDALSARDHLAQVKLPTLQRAGFICLGRAAIGDREEAKKVLEEIRQTEPAMAQRIEDRLLEREVTL